jgi:sugar O-acyltransferase (sialic acid O-acetyltransferase NeuD family)
VNRVLAVGAGRFAEEVADVAADAGWQVAGCIEGLDERRADASRHPPILWVERQAAFEPTLPIVPAIGSPRRRNLVERLVSEGRQLVSIIHPSAVVAQSAVIEPGCVIFANVVVGARTRVGLGTIVNRGALIGHHTSVGAHVFVGPGANVAGGVSIGDEAYIGIGSIVREDRRVGARATVGAGAVVLGDVEPDITVVGFPAKPMAGR